MVHEYGPVQLYVHTQQWASQVTSILLLSSRVYVWSDGDSVTYNGPSAINYLKNIKIDNNMFMFIFKQTERKFNNIVLSNTATAAYWYRQNLRLFEMSTRIVRHYLVNQIHIVITKHILTHYMHCNICCEGVSAIILSNTRVNSRISTLNMWQL